MRKLRFYGAEKTYYATEHGYNSRLDELHASILLKKLIIWIHILKDVVN